MNDSSTIRMGQLLEQVQLGFSLSPCWELCSGDAALLAKGRDRGSHLQYSCVGVES